jgi:hypothetical protein
MLIVAGVRSKFNAAMLVVMVGVTIYLFVRGRAGSGAFMIGATIFIYGRGAALLGVYFGMRSRKRQIRRSGPA